MLTIINGMTGGLRLALVVFAAMSALAWARERGASAPPVEIYRGRAWAFMAAAVIIYSPAHAAWLFKHPLPPHISRPLDLIGTSCGCVSFIHHIAARGYALGLSKARVHRGMIVNAAVLLMIVGMAWLTR